MKIIFIFLVCIAILTVLYFLMIMPRMLYKPDTAPFIKWLYAHRGFHDNKTGIPENSLAAFRRAVEEGFGIELDVQCTKDGIPVVFHDFTLKRICGAEGKLGEYTYEELRELRLCGTGERIPKLEEVLQLVDGRVPLIVELKIERTDMSLCPAVDRLLSVYQGLYCIESFNPLAVFWYRRHRREIVRGQLSDAFLKEGEYVGAFSFLLQNLLFNWVSRPDFIAYNCKYPQILSRRICRGLYHSKTAAWTVRSMEQLAEAKKYFDFFIFDSFMPINRIQ
nr:glycerophosphodiester phosphodiesterase family protein [uncultured Acetatifactor sp.]